MRSGAVSDEQRAGQGNARKQYALRFQEKGGKSREISVRRDLEMFIHAYLDVAGIGAENKDRPFFRSTQGKTKRLTGNPLTTKDVSRMVKRRLKDAGLPSRLSPYSFRVTAITSLLEQGGPDGRRAIPGRACGAANHDALRPAEKEGHAEHRREDSDMRLSFA